PAARCPIGRRETRDGTPVTATPHAHALTCISGTQGVRATTPDCPEVRDHTTPDTRLAAVSMLTREWYGPAPKTVCMRGASVLDRPLGWRTCVPARSTVSEGRCEGLSDER